jgi:hypothetical protein
MFWTMQNQSLNVHGAQEPIPLYCWARRPMQKGRRAAPRVRHCERAERASTFRRVSDLSDRLAGYREPFRPWLKQRPIVVA